MLKKFNTNTLDVILDKMVDVVGTSKDEIFLIGEQCRQSYESLTDELSEVRLMVSRIIEEGDVLERRSRVARNNLSIVSMHFRSYSEEEVREAYEHAHQLQMELTMNRQTEKQLRDRRDDIERRLLGLAETIDRAEHLVSQVSVVMSYLTSDLKQVGEVLEDAKLKQDFGLKIIEAQEEERKRLSREIHDGPAQMMANVMMRSDLIEKVYYQSGANDALAEVKNLKKMVRSALYEVRRIIYDLRPMALDDLGLSPTLKKYLQTTEDYHSKTKIRYQSIGEEKRLPSKYEVSLFRLIQESVQNALKHAHADTIHVKLEMSSEYITAIVKDDGQGFDIDIRKPESFGIIGMRERVELLNGELQIESKPGRGTLVYIRVPLNNK